MRKILVVLLLFIQGVINAQSFTPQQQEVINAENSFAGLSRSANTRDAFMAYLSDSTIMFDGQNKPVPGISLYKDRKPNNSLLFWWPVFVGASSDGTMGFSTGPWEFSPTKDTLPVAFGYYATVWQKDKDGKWKMAVDLGIQLPPSEKSNPPLKASPNYRLSAAAIRLGLAELLAMDGSYNQLLKTASYIKGRFSDDAHLLRSDKKPFTTPAAFVALDEKGKSFSYSQSYGGVAGSNDLFYAYGTARISTADGKITDAKYLRVWKVENDNWRIVLDVLSN
jgi:ketosteroid isomerase-like protein